MNKKKRNLILASAIINLVNITISLIMSILLVTNDKLLKAYEEFYYVVSFSYTLTYAIISFAVGLIGSILLIYSVRSGGKFFRRSQGIYIAGFIIVVLFGGFLSWLLLFISLFVPDVIIINSRSELRQEERMEERDNRNQERAYEEKKRKIEELKRLRDSGAITEEEYKEKLFDLL